MTLPSVEFAGNPDPRAACMLLLDASKSMSGAPIAALTEAIRGFHADLLEDPLARRRIELSAVAFGGNVRVLQPFALVENFQPPELVADGVTPMGQALVQGMRMLKARKEVYRAEGILYYQPWMVLITDGEPTDAWQTAAQAVRREVDERKLVFYGVGVANANLQVLQTVTDQVFHLEGLKFRELFRWISESQKNISRSRSAPDPDGRFIAPT